MYMHCDRPGDCFWTSQTLFAKRYKDVPNIICKEIQVFHDGDHVTDLNAPG
jgi:hypothetical protein